MSITKVSLEDFILAFAITALSVVIYPILTKSIYIEHYKSRKMLYGIFFIIGLISMIVFNILLEINSVVISSIVFFILSIYILAKRKDLIKIGLVSTGLVTLIMVPIYGLNTKISRL